LHPEATSAVSLALKPVLALLGLAVVCIGTASVTVLGALLFADASRRVTSVSGSEELLRLANKSISTQVRLVQRGVGSADFAFLSAFWLRADAG